MSGRMGDLEILTNNEQQEWVENNGPARWYLLPSIYYF